MNLLSKLVNWRAGSPRESAVFPVLLDLRLWLTKLGLRYPYWRRHAYQDITRKTTIRCRAAASIFQLM